MTPATRVCCGDSDTISTEVLTPMNSALKGTRLRIFWWILLLALLGIVSCQRRNPINPTATEGWDFTILHTGLLKVDNIAVDPKGNLFVSLELIVGKVLRLSGTRKETIAEYLRRPDGLLLTDTHLFVTEEVSDGRVLKIDLNDKKIETLLHLEEPEGIDQTPEGILLVAEDTPGGRVLRIAPNGMIIDALVEGLNRPEGVAVAPDGTAYVTETKIGRVLAITPASQEVIITGLNRPDQVAITQDGIVWITEDAKPGRLLYYENGKLTIVMKGLWFPQGIAFRDDEVLVAEQGRGRILSVRRKL